MDHLTVMALSEVKDINHELEVQKRRKDRFLFLVICGLVIVFTPLIVLAGFNLGFGLFLIVLALAGLMAVIVRWPLAGLWVIASCVVLIDQAPLITPVLTDSLYVYSWPTALQGLIERPIGFLFLFLLFVIACRRALKHETILRGGPLIVPFLLFFLCLVGGAFYGYLTGGDLKIIVVELRPFIYLFEAYLIAYNLVERSSHVRIFFWFVIIGAGVKALQGIYIYLKLHGQLGDATLMSHEESFFFIGLLLLVILLSLHGHHRPQLIAALAVLPFVVVTLVLNNRRADYVAFLFGLGAAWMLLFSLRQQSRTLLLVILLTSLLLGGGYIALFGSSTSGIGLPAHALISVFNPSSKDTRNTDSNLYRIVENFDLKDTVEHDNLLFGLGFGKPYLQPIPLTTVFPGIAAADLYYAYVPHNNIYWVWIRLGAVGFMAFWFLIGSIILRGSLIARQLSDRYLQIVAVYAVCMTCMEIIVAFADYQLFFYRNMIYIGLLAGMLVKLPALDKGGTRLEER